ncbi:MAG: c-type cytochrome biogenesis protein CcmI [Alphaproteobacteria bacterium]
MSIAVAIGLVGLTSLAVGLLLLPLLARRHQPQPRETYNLAVYRDQLAEIDRDLLRGLLTAAQTEAARAEIGRRILALDEAETPPPVGRSGSRSVNPGPLRAAIIAILAMPVAALLLYAGIGSPGLPDRPFAARASGGTGTAADDTAQLNMQEALAKLRAHLKTKPDDLTGWLLLARSEVGLGRYSEGAAAYRRAAELSSYRPDIAADWGEAQVMAEGAVTASAAKAFEAGLKDPASAPKSRYYLAQAKLEQGDPRGALLGWADLAADSPPDAEWQKMLRRRIAEVATAAGIDPASVMPSATSAMTQDGAVSQSAATSRPPESGMPESGMPSQEDVAAAAKATAGDSPEERRVMIESMVERLASRLEEQPDDAEGWVRLGRSYMVLQQPAKARDAYARAATLRPKDPALAAALAEATRLAADPGPGAAPSDGR